jgi:hypothetical protein
MSNELTILKEQVMTLQSQLNNQKDTILNDSLFSESKAPYYRQLAMELSKSGVIPKCFTGRPTDLFVAMSMGYQLGLSIEQSIQDIAVINGRPVIWGDGLLAVVMKHPDFVDIIEEPILNGSIVAAFKCTVKRRGRADKVSVFSLDDATRAGLLQKPGPWKQYPARMLKMRARSFACRDAFPDALRGIKIAEEVSDYIDAEFTTQTTMTQSSPKSRTELLKQQYKQRQGVTVDEIKSPQDSSNMVNKDIDMHSTQEASEGTDADKMDAPRHETTVVELTAEDLATITDDELDYISGMLSEKNVEAEKLAKALKYLKADSVEVMNHNQATRFVQMLDRLPSPM